MVALFPSVNLDKTFHKNKEAWNESSYSNIEKHSILLTSNLSNTTRLDKD